jgi:hypothetical protein
LNFKMEIQSKKAERARHSGAPSPSPQEAEAGDFLDSRNSSPVWRTQLDLISKEKQKQTVGTQAGLRIIALASAGGGHSIHQCVCPHPHRLPGLPQHPRRKQRMMPQRTSRPIIQ